MAFKIIVLGPPAGELRSALLKLKKLHEKNNFALAIIVGDLFGESGPSEEELKELYEGIREAPLPTYFSVGRRPLPAQVVERLTSNGDELVPNLYFLGKRTVLKTAEGLRLVSLCGLPSADAGVTKDRYSPFYAAEDAKSLRGANKCDILITTSWPAGVRNGSKSSLREGFEVESPGEDPVVADLCATLRPRYHFSSSPDLFYEREPFFHPTSEPSGIPPQRQITRFLNLASSTNSSKQKSLYAFNIDPDAEPITSIPPGTTPSPLNRLPEKGSSKKRPNNGDDSRTNGYTRFDNGAEGYGQGNSKRARKGRDRGLKKRGPVGPNECFFCLANPNLATHLITSIGSECYLTMARGPLTTPSSLSEHTPLFPTHTLIIPLPHAPTFSSMSETESSTTRSEMHRYRQALQSMIRKYNSSIDEPDQSTRFGSITWEVSRSSGVHLHWQFIAVPSKFVDQGLLEAGLKVEVENEGWPMRFETESKKDDPEGDFFRVWIWSPTEDKEKAEKCLTLSLPEAVRFDLQFGRRVLAKLYGLDKDSKGGKGVPWDWKECLQSVQEEQRDVEMFKERFKEFDFTS